MNAQPASFLGLRSDVHEISDISAMRSCVTWYLVTEIPRKVNGLIFKGGILQDQTTRLSRNFGNKTSINVARHPRRQVASNTQKIFLRP